MYHILSSRPMSKQRIDVQFMVKKIFLIKLIRMSVQSGIVIATATLNKSINLVYKTNLH